MYVQQKEAFPEQVYDLANVSEVLPVSSGFTTNEHLKRVFMFMLSREEGNNIFFYAHTERDRKLWIDRIHEGS